MQMNRFVQLHDKFSCAFFWRLNSIKLSVAVLFFVSGKYNYKLRGTERGNVQLHEFKFNRIIFFDGCKMDISLSAPNHHHKLIIIVSIDLQFDVAFFINTGLQLSVLLSLSLLLSLVCFWLKQSLESCAIKIEMVFQCLKMNVVASLALHTYAHTNTSTAKCCKCSHPSWIIKSFGYLFHFYVRFHTLFASWRCLKISPLSFTRTLILFFTPFFLIWIFDSNKEFRNKADLLTILRSIDLDLLKMNKHLWLLILKYVCVRISQLAPVVFKNIRARATATAVFFWPHIAIHSNLEYSLG